MVDCEMCGKKDANIKAKVEGTTMTVCSSCAKFGEVVQTSKRGKFFNRNNSSFRKEDSEEKVISNISQEVKRLRREKNITPEELAKQVNEKESIILKIESGSFRPSIKLANKLGKFFHTRFVRKEQPAQQEQTQEKEEQNSQKHRSLTMGDILAQAMKKK